MKKFLLLFAILTVFQYAKAQTDSIFWFVAPKITTGHTRTPIEFKMASFNSFPVTVRLSKPADPSFTPVTATIPANGDYTITYTNNNDLIRFENNPAGQVNNFGVLIEVLTENASINAYYEVSTSGYNPEIYSLKGKNALGVDFIIPGQSQYVGGSGYTPKPWNAADIVATEDGTTVTITPTAALQGGRAANVPFTITLNKGQTFSCASTGILPAQHIHGTKVTSNKPIAITVTDDSVGLGGGYDLIGDQIVPTNIVGTEYIAIRGELTKSPDINPGNLTGGSDRHEKLYIYATQPNTTVKVSNAGFFAPPAVINPGREPLILPFRNNPDDKVLYIKADKPIYVFQLTGSGEELGSALLPAITCTGSRKIKYKRGGSGTMRLNICVPEGGEDKFLLDGSPNVITAAQFEDVPGIPNATPPGWKYVSLTIPTNIFPYNAVRTIECEVPFHMGTFEVPSGGCNYGYFSDYGLMTDLTPISGKVDNKFCVGDVLVLSLKDNVNLKNVVWTGPGGWTANGADVQRANLQVEHSGEYIVTAEHEHGCTVEPSIVEVIVNEVTTSFTKVDIDCITHERGSAEVTISQDDGTGSYDIMWASTDSPTVPTRGNFNPTGLEAGTYYYTVTDNVTECRDSKSFVIEPEVVYTPVVTNTGPACAGLPVKVEVAEIAGISTYAWSTPTGDKSGRVIDISNSQLTDLGVYTVSVTDNFGCSGVGNTTLIINPALDVEITGETFYCVGSTVELQATQGYNQYQWSGPNNLGSAEGANTATITRTPAIPEMTGTYTVTVTSASGCSGTKSVNVRVEQSINVSFNVPDEVCTGSGVVTLNANPSGGIWSVDASTPVPNGTLIDNKFYPNTSGVGQFQLNYWVRQGDCETTASTFIEVGHSIVVTNFKEECSQDGLSYSVTFNVGYANNPNGDPLEYYVSEDKFNFTKYTTGTYGKSYASNTGYYLEVRGPQDYCESIVFKGKRKCDCPSFAGAMTSNSLVRLCGNISTAGKVSHDGEHQCDNSCIFAFILYKGEASNPTNILASNPTSPIFDYNSIPGVEYGTEYYISAVAGIPGDNGLPNPTHECYSISPPTPVMWIRQPIASIISPPNSTSICGKEIVLQADLQGQENVIGVWGRGNNENFNYSIIEGNFDSVQIKVVVSEFGPKTFRWTVKNDVCEVHDEVQIGFMETPSAYAGKDTIYCGRRGTLAAIFDSEIASGLWTTTTTTGVLTFAQPTNNESMVTLSNDVDYGSFPVTWTETRSGTMCSSSHTIYVTFVRNPILSVASEIVEACGSTCDLEVKDEFGEGEWVAYENGNIISPQPNFSQGKSSKKTKATIQTLSTDTRVIEFRWTSTINYGLVDCSGSISITATFYRVPQASITGDPSKKIEVCGNCVDLSAVAVNGTGLWSTRTVYTQVTYNPDPNSTNVTFCNNSTGLYGNTGRDSTRIVWTVTNGERCAAADSVTVYFHQIPTPNAGPDASVCGNMYTLYATYGIPELAGTYQHSKEFAKWSAKQPGAEFKPFSGDPDIGMNIQNVTVTIPSDKNSETWRFYFEEKNIYLDKCSAVDSVDIEFIKIPSVSVGVETGYTALVCGTETVIKANPGGSFVGSWTIIPEGPDLESITNPLTKVTSVTPGTYLATWKSSNIASTGTLQCEASATIDLTFVTKPAPSIVMEPEIDVCGLEYYPLRATPPASGNKGKWWSVQVNVSIENDDSYNNGKAIAGDYRTYDFYWVESVDDSRFPIGKECSGTTDTVKIKFLQNPVANAGMDTLFCDLFGIIRAKAPTSGMAGKWTTTATGVSIKDPDSPETEIRSSTYNTDENPIVITWTVSNTEKCTSSDQIQLVFSELPSSDFTIIPPRCVGETAILKANRDDLNIYEWDLDGGHIDTDLTAQYFPPKDNVGNNYACFVAWNNNKPAYRVRLHTTEQHEIGGTCRSHPGEGIVTNPEIPGWESEEIIDDECDAGIGQIKFNLNETGADLIFRWNNDYEAKDSEGNIIGENGKIDRNGVFGLKEGKYTINAEYRTPNKEYMEEYRTYYGSVDCFTDIDREIRNLGKDLKAEFEISSGNYNLIPPATDVTFRNISNYDGLRKSNLNFEWHLGDGNDKNVIRSSSDLINASYAGFEPGCYTPYLVIKHKLYDCRSKFELSNCIKLDSESLIDAPNVFTPNNDGINDIFQVRAVSIETFKGIIMNRWGRPVFEWSDPNGGWDGKINGSSEASPGIYYYRITATGLDGVEHDKEGFLHLIK